MRILRHVVDGLVNDEGAYHVLHSAGWSTGRRRPVRADNFVPVAPGELVSDDCGRSGMVLAVHHCEEPSGSTYDVATVLWSK